MSAPRLKTRTRRFRYLSLLAAAGLLTASAAPAWSAQNITKDSAQDVVSEASTGLSINNDGTSAGENVTGRWNVGGGNFATVGELTFLGTGSGGANLEATGDGPFLINGDIINNNTGADSTISVTGGGLLNIGGDVKGNSTKLLTIKSDGTVNGRDVEGGVALDGTGNKANFIFQTIGANGAANVSTGGQMALVVNNGLGAGGDVSLDLGGRTTAMINGPIGNGTTVNKINVGANSTLSAQNSKVTGSLTVINHNAAAGSAKLGQLGDGSQDADLMAGGTVSVSGIESSTTGHTIRGGSGGSGPATVIVEGRVGNASGTTLTIGGTAAEAVTVETRGQIHDAGGVTIEVKTGSKLTAGIGSVVKGIVSVANNSGATDGQGQSARLGVIDGSIGGGTEITVTNDVSAAAIKNGTVTVKGSSLNDKLFVSAIGDSAASTDVIVDNDGNLQADSVIGTVKIDNGGTAALKTVGADSGATTLTVANNNVDIGAINGKATINADGGGDQITMKDFAADKTTDLGRTDKATDITLGSTGGNLTVNLVNIVGGADDSTATTINLDTGLVSLDSTNTGGQADVYGHVNMKLTGSSTSLSLGALKAASVFTFDSGTPGSTVDFAGGLEGDADETKATTINLEGDTKITAGTDMDTGGHYALNLNGTTSAQDSQLGTVGLATENTTLTVGGANNAATVDIASLTGGTADKSTTLKVKDQAAVVTTSPVTGNVNVINDSGRDKAITLAEVGNGVLKVGGAKATNVTKIDAATGLSIASVDGQNPGTVELAAGAIQSGSKVNLKNAVLKLAADNSGLGALGGDFTMDSTDGQSRLWADNPAQQALTFTNSPMVTVGSGGDVVIETKSLVYNGVLKTAAAQGEAGAVFFNDATGQNRLVFKSSDTTNTFNQGVQVDGGQFEFQGATVINTQSGDEMKNADIYFTGNSAAGDPAPSAFTINGNALEAAGATLHINKGVSLGYGGGASLDNLETIALASDARYGEDASLTFVPGTIITAKNLESGLKLASGAYTMATVGNLSIGRDATPDFTEGLKITESATLSGKVRLEGALNIYKNGADPSVYLASKEAGFILTDGSAASSIQEGASIQIDSQLYQGQGFKQIAFLAADPNNTANLAQTIADMMNNLTLDLTNTSGLIDEDVYMDDNGNIYYTAASVDDLSAHVPGFARRMVAAAAFNKPLGDYLAHGADPNLGLPAKTYHRELTQVMGNTLNSSMMLVHNGTTTAFGRLNATMPPTIGYKTALAVAAPAPAVQRPAPAAAPAIESPIAFGSMAADSPQVGPSPAIGVPLRATDAPSAVPAPPQAPPAPSSGSYDGRPHGLWITPTFTKTSVEGNYKKGYGDFDVKSFGVTFGYDQWVNENSRLGAFFSYNGPELTSRYQDIEADDVQLGFYGQGIFPNGLVINAGFAVGWQDYDSKRDVSLSGLENFNQKLKADYSGDSFSAALEFSRPFIFDNDVRLRPAIGYNYQKTSLDSIREKSTVVDQANSLAQRISSSTFTTQLVRLGADVGWNNPDQSVALTGRAYWVANVGDTRPEASAKFLSAGGAALPFKVRGGEYDDHLANLGLGLNLTPAGSPGIIISLDYDALLGSDTTSHNLALMFRYEF